MHIRGAQLRDVLSKPFKPLDRDHHDLLLVSTKVYHLADRRTDMYSTKMSLKSLHLEPAQIILSLRTRLKLSQTSFAERAGVYITTVSLWETGKHVPSRLAWAPLRQLAVDLGAAGVDLVEQIDRARGAL
jgi:DNA-binding transcriptional regulator YiaG